MSFVISVTGVMWDKLKKWLKIKTFDVESRSEKISKGIIGVFELFGIGFSS
jgi:hypothetical protein